MSHCHCSLLNVTQDMVGYMNESQPRSRYHEELRVRPEKERLNKAIMDEKVKADQVKEASDLKIELANENVVDRNKERFWVVKKLQKNLGTIKIERPLTILKLI